MATPPPVSDTPEVAEHYATQVALTASLMAAIRRLRPQLTADPSDEYLALVAALVDYYALSSISESADHYEDMRELAGILAPFVLPLVDPPEEDAIEAAILAALAGADLAPDLDETEIIDAVQNLIEGITQSLVMEAGRDQLWTAIESDPEAAGWARVTRPGACAFCRMLATRGAVYKTERSASFQAHMRDENGGGDCRCGVEPLFAKTYEPPAHVRADQALWKRVTKGVSGPDKLNEFRRAIEGRSDGPRRKRRRLTPSAPQPHAGQQAAISSLLGAIDDAMRP